MKSKIKSAKKCHSPLTVDPLSVHHCWLSSVSLLNLIEAGHGDICLIRLGHPENLRLMFLVDVFRQGCIWCFSELDAVHRGRTDAVKALLPFRRVPAQQLQFLSADADVASGAVWTLSGAWIGHLYIISYRKNDRLGLVTGLFLGLIHWVHFKGTEHLRTESQ